MLEARNIWDLVVRRAEETPDREMAVDETGRRLTFGDYRDRCERAAAGLAALRRGRRHGRVVGPAHHPRGHGPVRRAAPAGRGAEPDPADLPRARGRLHRPPGRARGCWSCPRRGGASTTGPWPRPSPRAPAPRCVVVDDRAARGRPGTLPPAARRRHDGRRATCRCGSSTTRRARPPSPRAPATATARCGAASVGHVRAAGPGRATTASPSCSRITHVAGGVYTYAALAYGLTFVLDAGLRPRHHHRPAAPGGHHPGRGGHVLPPDLPEGPAGPARGREAVPPHPHVPRRRGAQAAEPAPRAQGRRSAPGWCRATA